MKFSPYLHSFFASDYVPAYICFFKANDIGIASSYPYLDVLIFWMFGSKGTPAMLANNNLTLLLVVPTRMPLSSVRYSSCDCALFGSRLLHKAVQGDIDPYPVNTLAG
jgi:hypothetical protein